MAIGDNVLPAQRATKIAESDNWTAWARIGSILGGGLMTLVVAPLAVWMATTTYNSSLALTDHTRTITDIQTTVNEIKGEAGTDHDWVTILKSEVEGPGGLIDQIQKLWNRPARSDRSPP